MLQHEQAEQFFRKNLELPSEQLEAEINNGLHQFEQQFVSEYKQRAGVQSGIIASIKEFFRLENFSLMLASCIAFTIVFLFGYNYLATNNYISPLQPIDSNLGILSYTDGFPELYEANRLLGHVLQNDSIPANTTVLSKAGRSELSLKDGSIVRLDSDSKLNLKKEGINITLLSSHSGAAFFKITPGNERIIQVNNYQIKASNVTFALYNNAEKIAVEVYQGTLKVTSTNSSQVVEVSKGYALDLSDKSQFGKLTEFDLSERTKDQFINWNLDLDDIIKPGASGDTQALVSITATPQATLSTTFQPSLVAVNPTLSATAFPSPTTVANANENDTTCNERSCEKQDGSGTIAINNSPTPTISPTP